MNVMSDNIAYYLKYRPQTLDELIGQEAVKSALSLSFQNNKLSHAYLFVGPRGTGKTSLARILAKMVNCEGKGESGKGEVPCNNCATCLSITDGSNLDLIEIDAASNRGIDDIRSLRDKIKLAPAKAEKKVYIIDEVHMLTAEAFNALLKTLEEPPSHVLFILATTDAAKIPQTILSRVQRLDFKLAKGSELLEALQKIAKKEKIDIDEGALKLLVKKSDGSFRDGVKLLDQVSSIKGKITAKSLEESLKSAQFDDLLDLIKIFSRHSAEKSLLNITKQMENGVDAKELMLALMDILRNFVFIKNGLGEELVKPQFTEDKYGELFKVAADLPGFDLTSALDILQDSLEKLKFASIPSLPLELAAVKICGENNDKASEVENVSNVSKASDISNDSNSPDIQKLKEKWNFVLETIRPYNFSLEALLRSINVSQCSESQVYMEVPYAFHQRILEAPKNRDLLEGVLSDILGRSIRIAVSLGNRPRRREDIANIDLAQDDDIIRAAAEIFNSDNIN